MNDKKVQLLSISTEDSGEILGKNPNKEQLAKIREILKDEGEFKEGDTIFILFAHGEICEEEWFGAWENLRKQGNIFKTREEAEMEKLRREARANGDKVECGEEYYYWSFHFNNLHKRVNNRDTSDIMHFRNGNMFPCTEEGKKKCEEFGRKYSEAFKIPKK